MNDCDLFCVLNDDCDEDGNECENLKVIEMLPVEK